MSAENEPGIEEQDSLNEDRREFLAACGKFAVVTPPALTVLLSTSLNSEAVAKSGGGHDKHPHDGPRHGDRDRDLLEWLERLLSRFF